MFPPCGASEHSALRRARSRRCTFGGGARGSARNVLTTGNGSGPHSPLRSSLQNPKEGGEPSSLPVCPTCSASAGPVPSDYTSRAEATGLSLPTSRWPATTAAWPGRWQRSRKWPPPFPLLSSSKVNRITSLFCLKPSRAPTARVGGNPPSCHRAQGPSPYHPLYSLPGHCCFRMSPQCLCTCWAF